MELDPAVAHVYAEALIAVAQQQNKLDLIFDQAEQIYPFFQRGAPLRIFLENPHIRRDHQHDRLDRIFKDRIDPLLLNLIHLMLNNNRIENLDDTLHLVYELVEELRGIVPAMVITAVPLDEPKRAEMKRTFEERFQSRFDIRYRVDPNILGGVIFKFRDDLIDGSLKFDLRRLFDRLMAAPLPEVASGVE